MKARRNEAKDRFLRRFTELDNITIDSHAAILKDHLSFSFRYFDSSQSAGQDFAGWDHNQLIKLLNKLKEYCRDSLEHWKNERIGGSGLRVLAVYDRFPQNSGFNHPKHVPDDVQWARFRLEQKVRLCGFLVPEDKVRQHELRKNVFYVVFLDKNHEFYRTESE